MAFEIKLDLDPVVLYDNSEIDEIRDSAFQLGRELKKARMSSGLTQQELVQRVGTSKFYISKIENSKSDIGYKTLLPIKIAVEPSKFFYSSSSAAANLPNFL